MKSNHSNLAMGALPVPLHALDGSQIPRGLCHSDDESPPGLRKRWLPPPAGQGTRLQILLKERLP